MTILREVEYCPSAEVRLRILNFVILIWRGRYLYLVRIAEIRDCWEELSELLK